MYFATPLVSSMSRWLSGWLMSVRGVLTFVSFGRCLSVGIRAVWKAERDVDGGKTLTLQRQRTFPTPSDRGGAGALRPPGSASATSTYLPMVKSAISDRAYASLFGREKRHRRCATQRRTR